VLGIRYDPAEDPPFPRESGPGSREVQLRFRLFGIPVTVEPIFFFVVGFLGIGRERLDLVALWMAAVFVSILVHELGHAFAGRRLGLAPAIRLHGMGGQTEWISPGRMSGAQRIGISFAGPGAGFLLAGLVYAAQPLFAQVPDWRAQVVYADLLWINLGWGILNLLPVLPMDGGHIMQTGLHGWLRRRDDYWPYLISAVVSGLAACLALAMGRWWAAFLASWFCYGSLRIVWALPRTPLRRAREGARAPSR
jgi:stage IV sporulation protein FB